VLTVAHQKTTGQIVGVVTRTSKPDGAGDPVVLLAPGVRVAKSDGSFTVTIPAADLLVTPLDEAAFPALQYDLYDYQMKDGAPVSTATAGTGTLTSTTITFGNAADEEVYARIESDNLPEPITHTAKPAGANYSVALPALPPGVYRFVVFVEGKQPVANTKTL
jgi:hypothetical protein